MDGLAAVVGIWLTLVGAPPTGALVQESAEKAIPGEGMYPRPSREVWEHAKTVLQKAGFRPERQDNKTQILVTQWRSYDAALFPAVAVEPGERVTRVQLHVMVATTHEPARVVVGSIVESERRAPSKRTETLVQYRVDPLEEWFLGALDARVGVKHEPLASTPEARAEQASRLGTGETTCVPKPNVGFSPPKKLSDVRPVFPAQGFDSGEGKVLLQAWITEHGSVTGPRILNPSQPFAHYEASARAAVSLWRFKPQLKEACPVQMFFTVTVTYTLR